MATAARPSPIPDAIALRSELPAGDAALPQPASYAVEAREERFETVGATTYRSNEIWRVRASDGVAAEELVRRNRARVAYPVARSADDSTPRSGE